ncbi:MAG: hypothetical protein DMF64_11690 [Acidobacteria bacterium]|nr:MAG: hypothetical protein DMF64_11690 [Acidobacteriota bacterium]
MAKKQEKSIIYSVAQTDNINQLTVKEVAQPTTLKASYANLTPVTVQGKTYLLGYNATADAPDLYEFTASAPWLQTATGKFKVGAGYDIIEPFTLGNKPFVACYKAKDGVFSIFSIANDLSISGPYKFFRNHEPALTQGFTTLKAFVCFGIVVFLGYNGANGYVATYTMSTIATSPPNTPPLLMTPQWSHVWAKGWTRFAFFQLGGENFFFKTNTWKPNVNIDHVLDNLAAGTTEVASNLNAALKDAQTLDIVQPLVLGNGDPYFVTYMKNGQMTLNRFHSDCMGWTTVATLTAKANATQVVPLGAGDNAFLLVT